jgi:hypothetical protein
MSDPITPFVAPTLTVLNSAANALSTRKQIEKARETLVETTDVFQKYEKYYDDPEKADHWRQART